MNRAAVNSAAVYRAKNRSARNARVGVESLEGRQLMSHGLTLPWATALTHGPAVATSLDNHKGGGVIHVDKPTPQPPRLGPLPAELKLVSFEVTDLGSNQVKLTATLQNGFVLTRFSQRRGTAYKGGGQLQITETSGGTTLVPATAAPYFGATPDQAQTITTKKIPKLDFGKSITLTVNTTGRAIFTAAAVPSYNAKTNTTPPLPALNPNDLSTTVDSLIPGTLPINTATLNLLPGIQNAQIVLDSANSSIMIPGLVSQQFSIPGTDVHVSTLVGTITETYKVNNLQSTSVALSYQQSGVAITATFADNNHALHTDSTLFPDVSVQGLQIQMLLPLNYAASDQGFYFGQPQVQVNGNWSANGPLSFLYNLLLPDVNQKVQTALTEYLDSQLATLSYQFTSQIDALTAGGRIVSADIEPGYTNLAVETPAPLT